jgi:hypothetical protein
MMASRDGGTDARYERLLPWAIALVAAAALAYQLLLMRLLAIVHWYPFAAMIVSLALLGHGASGTALALAGERARRHAGTVFVACAAGFALLAPLAFALAQRLPFNGLALVWDAAQLGWLAAMYLLLALPFGLAATCFGVGFVAFGSRIPRLYAADLIGAGVGAVGLLWLLDHEPLVQCLRVVALLALAGSTLAAYARFGNAAGAAVLLASFAVMLPPDAWLQPRPNQFKDLSRALLVPEAHVVAARSGALGLVQVLESPSVPLRHAPGLSLAATAEPAPQLGVFVDGDGPSPITRRDRGGLEHLGQTTSALPYALLDAPRVLVLGAGGGADVLQALELGASAVTAVERDPHVVALVRDTFGDYAGRLYDNARVQVVQADPRRALATLAGPFDLIVWPLADSATGAGGGTRAASDQFAYTVEAVRAAYARLAPGGLLAATRWDSEPPRDNLKLFATFVAALRAEGVADPGAQLAMVRGWQTGTLLLKRGAFTPDDVVTMRGFATRLSFDAVHWPGLDPADANRFNVVDGDPLAAGARALLGPDAGAFVAAHPFDLRPATDDRPFFHNLFRWRSLPALWRLREAGAGALLDSGYLLAAATLAQAVPLSLALVLLPLAALRRATVAVVPRARWAAYFACLGLGFLFIEIAAMSRVALVVGDALLGASLVLAVLLVFAGAGSAFAARWCDRPRAMPLAVVAIVVALAAFETTLAPTTALAGDSLVARATVAGTLLAPLAFAMGVPFPLALARLAREAPAFVPWAWGINGCASVASALLALLLAIAFGYGVVLVLAAVLYLLAALAWPNPAA